MRTFIYAILMVFCTLSTSAQSVSDVIGDWKFYTVVVPSDKTDKQREDATMLMSTITMLFNPDKTYQFNLIGLTETGKWDVIDKKIVFTTSEAKSYEYPITAFEKNLLTLDFSKMLVVLSRVGANVPPISSPAIAKVRRNYVTAYTPQLIKKWYLKSCPAPENLTDAQRDAFGEMLSGSYIEFKTNDKCILQLGDKKETGRWHLNANKNGITTTLKNIPATMYFTKVTSADLLITEADKQNEWVFSVVE